MPDKSLLVLFDGNAIVHRAFHAIPMLTVSRTGEIVNAVYGFSSTLLKVLQELRPSHWAIAFDLPIPTFRHKMFAEYKIQRPPTPQELKGQMARVHEVVEAFRMPVFELPGYEADDVLGTLARQAAEQGIETVIVTGDADMLQLVRPQVKVLVPQRSFSDTILYDDSKVSEKYGLSASQLTDLKALVGDASDNIPGVPGIGPKTAAKLLQEFGSLETVYSRIAEVKPEKLQKLLLEHKEQALKSRELATIVTAAPLSLDLQCCGVADYDRERVTQLFQELEFFKLLSRLPREFAPQAVAARQLELTPHDWRIIVTEEDFSALLSRLQSAQYLALDVQTTGTNAMSCELVGVALAVSPEEPYYIPVGHRLLDQPPQLTASRVIAGLKPVLEDPGVKRIAHSAKFQLVVLAENGVAVPGFDFDTVIAAYLLGDRTLSLKAVAFNRLRIELAPITDLIGSGSKQITMAQVAVDKAAGYACGDAVTSLRLREVLEAEMREKGLSSLFSDVEMPLIPVLAAMERSGVALDTRLLRELSQELGGQMRKLETDIYNGVGHMFNVNSTQQLAHELYDNLHLPAPRGRKGQSTEAAVLESLRGLHPVVGLVLDYRQVAKLKSTYADALLELVNPRTGRVHTSFNQTGTVTGRLSSSDPNLQNIPIRGEWGRRIRQAFVAPPGSMLLAADYSQIDLRALAHLSRDEELIASFQRGDDIHRATAARVFGVEPPQVTPDMRRVAKTVNFGVIYGMSGYGLEQATEFSREEAGQFIAAYFQRYPGVKRYLEETREKARRLGYVETLLGRRRSIPEVHSPNRQLREAAERMAINMPVQGTSADIIKLAMIGVHREMGRRALGSKMLLQIHDELLFEVPEDELPAMEELVLAIMPRAVELCVPLVVELKRGRTWAEME